MNMTGNTETRGRKIKEAMNEEVKRYMKKRKIVSEKEVYRLE